MLDILRQIPNLPRINSKPLAQEDYRESSQLSQSWAFSIEGDSFDYQGETLLLNGRNLAKHLSENLNLLGTGYWSVVGRRLRKYQDWALANAEDVEELSQFMGLISAFLTQIYGRTQKKFDEVVDGISFCLEDGQFVLNGINVMALLGMVQRKRKENRLNEKSHVYLKGILSKLCIISRNRHGNRHYERVRGTVERLIQSIRQELNLGVSSVIALPPPRLVSGLA